MECEKYKNAFDEYSFLWLKNPEVVFEEFLNNESLYPKVKEKENEEGEEEIEETTKSENVIMKGVREKLPGMD